MKKVVKQKEQERRQLKKKMDEFLANGGKIIKVSIKDDEIKDTTPWKEERRGPVRFYG